MEEFKFEIPQESLDHIAESFAKLVEAKKALKKRVRIHRTIRVVVLAAVGASIYAHIKNQNEETE